ncbi:PLD nuclease N-terminal domain-containing protein (plasmid) [Cytobacillus spongiae]|uniref:PLD nuclease N-terminal domain-containing protein n=1 Tax=Cytobacillus spongiae TaxID=2901381 RepID=UPI00145E3D13|nr:PLD nuclease N-terminal domain-containing protein [Cytobacillus spongiae]MCA1063018.1 PLD nuclease N-terminal domain-containing protein [Rossellomorea aquimaris]NMH70351.1 PLDc_N domain-containing protein [Bacillus sp. RO3]UII58617.1 PLD nuclease N-terminal domain-containing protein [Cytobacillus spongiae]WJV28361.1 PLD nuclease N-terminal domain-containing protein [Rossellomorea sp. AcN35-11]
MNEIQEALQSINWGIVAPVILIQLILMVTALVDLIRIKETNGPKWLWVLIILLINIIGPVVYFIFGRRQNG